MACPALPLCGLAISEAERGLPDVNLRIRNLLNKLGFDQAEQFCVRMTGCPNGCSRPYMAELGFVGDGPNSYQIWLGGSPAQTRLAEPYLDRMKVQVRLSSPSNAHHGIFWYAYTSLHLFFETLCGTIVRTAVIAMVNLISKKGQTSTTMHPWNLHAGISPNGFGGQQSSVTLLSLLDLTIRNNASISRRKLSIKTSLSSQSLFAGPWEDSRAHFVSLQASATGQWIVRRLHCTCGLWESATIFKELCVWWRCCATPTGTILLRPCNNRLMDGKKCLCPGERHKTSHEKNRICNRSIVQCS